LPFDPRLLKKVQKKVPKKRFQEPERGQGRKKVPGADEGAVTLWSLARPRHARSQAKQDK